MFDPIRRMMVAAGTPGVSVRTFQTEERAAAGVAVGCGDSERSCLAATLLSLPLEKRYAMTRHSRRGAEDDAGPDLTTGQAAEMLGVTPTRVRQFIEQGRLGARRLGRDWVLRRAAVERFAAVPRSRTGRPSKSLRNRKDFSTVPAAGARRRT